MTDLEQRILTASPAAAGSASAAAYEAGRRDAHAASRRHLVVWRAAAGMLLAATLGLAVVGERDRPTAPTRATVGADAPAEPPTPPDAALPPESLLALRQAVLAGGEVELDRLPARAAGAGEPLFTAGGPRVAG